MILNPFIYIPFAYLLMLLSNNLYFFQFNWKFSDHHKANQEMDYSDYNIIWIGIYQLFRGIYYFTLIGLNIFYIKTIPNIFFYLFLVEFIRPLFRNHWWFFLVNLFGIISILLVAFLINI